MKKEVGESNGEINKVRTEITDLGVTICKDLDAIKVEVLSDVAKNKSDIDDNRSRIDTNTNNVKMYKQLVDSLTVRVKTLDEEKLLLKP